MKKIIIMLIFIIILVSCVNFKYENYSTITEQLPIIKIIMRSSCSGYCHAIRIDYGNNTNTFNIIKSVRFKVQFYNHYGLITEYGDDYEILLDQDCNIEPRKAILNRWEVYSFDNALTCKVQVISCVFGNGEILNDPNEGKWYE